MFLPSFLPPHLTYKHVTCCPCVVWNNWATAAKASELGNCGIVGTELAVTWGGSEVTFAGGGGEPKISTGMDKKLHYSILYSSVHTSLKHLSIHSSLFKPKKKKINSTLLSEIPQLHILFILPLTALFTARISALDTLRKYI